MPTDWHKTPAVEHTDLSTTTLYTQVSIEKLRRVHAATHPTGGAHEQADEADALVRALDGERDEEHDAEPSD